MPLPDATPDPKKANIYEQYSHITVKEFSPSDYDVVKQPLNLNSESEDVLRRLKLVGEVTNQLSSSGAIPGTIQFFQMNGVDNAVGYIDFGPGVWAVQDIIVYYTGGSGTLSFRGWYYDGVTPIEWYLGGSSSATYFSYNADSQFDELSVKRFGGDSSSNGGKFMQLGLKVNGTFTADSMTFYVVAYKVR